MSPRRLSRVLSILRREARRYEAPVVGHYRRDPFTVLVSCLLSLRTQDRTTHAAARRLFSLARTPRGILALPIPAIESAIYPVGFYRTKARNLHAISRTLIEKHGGLVPDEIETLLGLPGVGRKTANLVVTLGFGKAGICVDTHVHRIANRWGYVRTRTPEETEFALRKKLPPRHWIEINDLLVTWGQNVCRPLSPRCSECAIRRWCGRVGVERSR